MNLIRWFDFPQTVSAFCEWLRGLGFTEKELREVRNAPWNWNETFRKYQMELEMKSTPPGIGRLVLRRKIGEVICIGDDVRVKVDAVDGYSALITIEAPHAIDVDREEIRRAKQGGVR